MCKLFAVLLVAATASANEISYRSLQSGSASGPTTLFDHGIHGEGQIIAVLDTGVDWQSCYFAEPDGRMPPVNSVDLTRRKIVAYDLLLAGDAVGDSHGHGTHAAGAAVGDKGAPIVHDFGDAIAPGAKLIVQDGGAGNDNCTGRPGFGCPVNLTPILTQAYDQGARIHSNSWGDRQATSPNAVTPTANYSQSARDVDAFVWSHPDMLVVFNTGNYSGTGAPPASSLSAPGCAKNTLQVGGTRGGPGDDDTTLAGYSLVGPTRDGRIKPDVVGPAWVTAADVDFDNNPSTCDITPQGGTSWASPTVAGAAALVRQYYTAGYYPSGSPNPTDAFTPSAALLKATIIAAARPDSWRLFANGDVLKAAPTPSSEQGFGFPVLGDVLYFPDSARRLRVTDGNPLTSGMRTTTSVTVRAGQPLKFILVWTDPPGVVRGVTDETPELVNDLDLRVVAPNGEVHYGNEAIHRGQPDRLNNVEAVIMDAPVAGTYSVTVDATRIAQGPQKYALVMSGDFAQAQATSRTRAVRH